MKYPHKPKRTQGQRKKTGVKNHTGTKHRPDGGMLSGGKTGLGEDTPEICEVRAQKAKRESVPRGGGEGKWGNDVNQKKTATTV